MAEQQTELICDRDFVLLLISLYRDFPVLWKCKSREYADKHKRSAALTQIVKLLQVYKPTYTEDLLKKKINSLRTNFNKEKKRIEAAMRSGASTDDVPKPALYYYDELLFLSDQMGISETESSLGSEISASPDHQNDMPAVTPTKKSKKTPQDNLIEIATQYFKRPDSDSDVITKSWAIKLNRLAPDQRRYAEKIINDILFEGEMGTLSRNGVRILPASPTFYSPPSATMTSPYQSPSPIRPPMSPSPNSHHSTMTSPFQSPSPLPSPMSPSPNSQNSTMTSSYPSPSPLRPPMSPSPNSQNSTMISSYPLPSPLRPPMSPSPNSQNSSMTSSYPSPSPLRPPMSPSPNSHHSTKTYSYQSASRLRPPMSPSPNSHHSTMTSSYRSPSPLRPPMSPSPNSHHSSMTSSYPSPSPLRPPMSPSPNSHHSTKTYSYQSPSRHRPPMSPSPNSHHSTMTSSYPSPSPLRPPMSPSPNSHHSTKTYSYQSPSQDQSLSPNAHHSTTTYHSVAPHKSQVTSKSMVPGGATPLIILSSQPTQAPSQSYQQPVLIHIPDPDTEEEEESQTAAKYLENFYSF